MKQIKVVCSEAFSTQPGCGNPAGIVTDGNSLNEVEMQEIAKKVGFNETVFILKSDIADIRLRYFTPGHEMNLCGHGTMAAICQLMSQTKQQKPLQLQIETLAGVLNVDYCPDTHEVTMAQSPAEFIDFQGNIEELMSSIGLTSNDIDKRYPIVYGSTGTWTLLVPIHSLNTFQRMRPQNALFSNILKEIPTASIHPFCTETIHKQSDLHGRHFSASHSGTVEDPVTGTASGVMGAYYLNYMEPQDEVNLTIEQGQEIGRNGFVKVKAKKANNEIFVQITGTAIFTREIQITI